MRNIKILSTSTLLLALTACAPKNQEMIENSVAAVSDEIACTHYRYDVFQAIKEYTLQAQEIPDYAEFAKAHEVKLQELYESGQIEKDEMETLKSKTQELLKILLSEMTTKVSTYEEFISILSAVDVGDSSTPYKEYLNTKVNKTIESIQTFAATTAVECQAPAPADVPDSSAGDFMSVEAKLALNPAVLGSRMAMATAYQSCNTVKLPAMTAASPDVKGIEIFGTHPDGVGSKRRIASLTDVQKTHYYIKDESSYSAGCFDVRKNPLIYDYGGKPYATTSATSRLDFFTNNGDGTSVLGIDCSGFVFSSYATAGLKLSSARPLKASDSWSWGSSAYVEPQNNGLSCLQKITVSPLASLGAGDIIAVVGHVFVVDRVGTDPLGVSKVAKVEDCSKMSSDNFDFVINQSSNSKNGIGINSFEAKDYMKIAPKFKAGLEKYAYYACLAKFNKKNYTPSLGSLSVVRHKGTTACKAARVKLTKEECVSQCDFGSN